MTGKSTTKWTPDRISQLRTDLGLSPRELADEVGCHPVTVDNWIGGKHSPIHRYRDVLARLEATVNDDEDVVSATSPGSNDPRGDRATTYAVLPQLAAADELDWLTVTIWYPAADGPERIDFVGEIYAVITVPSKSDALAVEGETAIYAAPNIGRDELLVVIGKDGRLLDLELGPDGNRRPVEDAAVVGGAVAPGWRILLSRGPCD